MALKRLSAFLIGLALLAQPLQATWSIVCVNLRTREVGVATATCLEGVGIRRVVPVIFVGEGAAAAQSNSDELFGAMNRRLIYFSYRDTEDTPEEILMQLEAQDPQHQTRQYGIVNFAGDPVTFTGSEAGAAAIGVVGRTGDYLYAIQGNVLAGDKVVSEAEDAFRRTKGDMARKMMASMQAAKVMGGDGRCSCPMGTTTCGAPPPVFDKSAHVGTFIVARMGDANGGCNATNGCAKGEYYMRVGFTGFAEDPDPVDVMQERYDLFRANRIGVPDGVLSRTSPPSALPADGQTSYTVRLELRDIEDDLLQHDDVAFEITTVDGEAPLTSLGPIVSDGSGRFHFEVTAGTEVGQDRFMIRATTNEITATLFPFLEIESVEPMGLHVERTRVSAGNDTSLDLVLHEPERPLAPYWIAGTLYPLGTRLASEVFTLPALPLALDRSPFFPAAPLSLDGSGRGEATLDLPHAFLAEFLGARVEWQGIVLGDGLPRFTDPCSVDIRR